MAEKYHMLNEIIEQSEVLDRLWQARHGLEFQKIVEIIEQTVKNGGDIYLVGSGSSHNSCIFASYLFSINNKLSVSHHLSREFENFESGLNNKSLVIFVSQSGETKEMLEIVPRVKDSGAKLAAITNNADSTLAEEIDTVVPILAGEEIAVPATKTYFGELVTFAIISEILSGTGALEKQIDNIKESIEKITSDEYLDNIKSIAEQFAESSDMYILAEGLNRANAMEAELKIKETALIDAQGYPASEFRHGPISMIKEFTPVVLIVPSDDTKDSVMAVGEELKVLDTKIIGIATEKQELFDYFLPIGNFGVFTALITIIPLQLLAYEMSLEKGLTPDRADGVSKTI